jgi:hypothetical protein
VTILVKLGIFVGILACFVLVTMPFMVTEEGCGCKSTVNIATPVMEENQVKEAPSWDAILLINKVTPKEDRLRWKDLRVSINSREGEVLHQKAKLVSMASSEGGASNDGWIGSAGVGFRYIENGVNHRLDAEDIVRITGLSATYHGATVHLYHEGDHVGSAHLPEVFE